jgi:excisionase family DNA binding protein
MNEFPWITRAEACLSLGVSSRTLRRMVADDKIRPPMRIGNFRQLYYFRADFAKDGVRAMKN